MAAPIRVVNPASMNLSRQLFTLHYPSTNPSPLLLIHRQHSRNVSSKTLNHAIIRSPTCFSFPPTFPNSASGLGLGLGLGFSLPFSSFSLNSQPHYLSPPNHVNFQPSDGKFFNWHKASSDHMDGGGIFSGDGKCEVAAVVLGWLGATPKHLRRYAELYTSKGIDAITFVVPVKDVIWFDLGRKVEHRIRVLAHEIVAWLSEDKEKQRCLVFHTFSNTGWLVYGAILGHLQERPDLVQRIRGCIVDSGGDPELNPKVWAAGFAAALLKKRSTAIYPSSEDTDANKDRNQDKLQDREPRLTETALLIALEKLFSFLFKLPDVNRRLSRIISILSENPPPCPQLYLYSTADKVIPSQAVEAFIELQKTKGQTVRSFNFGSSPHVDHYRTFPDIYSSQVNSFLNEIFAVGK